MAIDAKVLDGIMVDLFVEPLRELYNRDSPLLKALEADIKRRKGEDEAYLSSLSPHDRKVELTRRRLSRCEARFAEALDFGRYYDE